MSKEKLPPEEGCDEGYIEIPLPNLSGIKDKVDEGLDPIFGKAGIVTAVLTGVIAILCAAFRADMGVILLMGFMTLLGLLLTVIGKYEIRFDGKGFSTRFGKRILREYKWSDVTDVQDGKKVWVQGKRLWTDHTFEDFSEFYKMARSACKGKGKPTPPSEKKRKNRKKAGK